MFALDVLSRIVHVLVAITVLGGSVFMLLVLMPSAKQLDESPHDTLAQSVTARWKRFVHLGVLLLLASGLYNYVRAAASHKGDSLYHALLGTKMLLALVVFFLASALVGRSEKLQKIRDHRAKWIRIVVLLGTIIVSISGFVKIRGIPVDSQTPQQDIVETVNE